MESGYNKLQNAIQEMDFFSDDVRLRIQNGNSNYKTVFGGILSLLSLFACIAALGYFLEKFFSRTDSNIISNEKLNENISIDNFNEIPFMIRLSDTNFEVKKNPKSWYTIKMTYNWSEKNETDPKKTLIGKLEFVDVVPCDLENPDHFNPRYKHLFQNQTDLYTFYCPDYKKVRNLYGQYGGTAPFSYFTYFIRGCRNESDGGICEEKKKVNDYLAFAYLDFRTINYEIDQYSINPNKQNLYGQRFLISNSVYRRIWMYYKNILYRSDFGMIFEEIREKTFYQIDAFINDIDIRDINTGSGKVPYAFLLLTLSNLKEQMIVTRTYMKAQVLLANMGGILKGISFIGYIINYFFSIKALNLYLINHLPQVKHLVNRGLSITDESHKKLGSRRVSLPIIKSEITSKNKDKNKLKNIEIDTMQDVINDKSKIIKIERKDDFNINDVVKYSENFSNDRGNIHQKKIILKDNYPQSKNFYQLNDDAERENEISSQYFIKNNQRFNNVNNTNPNELEQSNVYNKKKLIFQNRYLIKESDHDIKLNFQQELEIPTFPRYIDLVDINNVKNQTLSWYHYLLPDFLMCDNNKDVKLYKKSYEYLVQELDIANLLNKMNQFERLKQSSMTYDQLTAFNYLFQSQMEDDVVYASIYKHSITYDQFKTAYDKITKKEIKDSLDHYILSIVNV